MTTRSRVSQPSWRRRVPALLAAAGLAALMPAVGLAQARSQADPLSQGDVLYQLHCASCHGREAVGDGPMALALRHAPPDLTRLAANNGGVFPFARARRIVEGRDVQSHGDRDMPVWGDAFRGPSRTQGRATDDNAKILAILRYLESIQGRNAQ